MAPSPSAKKRRRRANLFTILSTAGLMGVQALLSRFAWDRKSPKPPVGLPIRKVEYEKLAGENPRIILDKRLAPKVFMKKKGVFQPVTAAHNVGLAYGFQPVYTRDPSKIASYRDADNARLNQFLQSWSDYVNYLKQKGLTQERAIQTLQYNQQFQDLTPEEREKIIEEVSGHYDGSLPKNEGSTTGKTFEKPEGSESNAYPLGYYFELPEHFPLDKYRELVERNHELLKRGRIAFLHPSGDIREARIDVVFSSPEHLESSLPPQTRENLQKLFREACVGLRCAGREPRDLGLDDGPLTPQTVPFYEHLFNGAIRDLIVVPSHAEKDKQAFYESFYNPEHDAFRWNALAHLLSTASPYPLEEHERE
jgi:hypothetical protein